MTASAFTARRTVQLLLGLLLFAMLGACSSLPVLHPDMGLQSTEPVQVEGARGPLSAQRSKAILDQLKSKNGEATVLDRHLAIEEAIVDSPLVAGNKVQLLQDGAGAVLLIPAAHLFDLGGELRLAVEQRLAALRAP